MFVINVGAFNCVAKHNTLDNLRRAHRFAFGSSDEDDLVEKTVEQTDHGDDEMRRRSIDQHLAAVSDVVETRLNEPVEQVV